jgi:hypothetical protein
MMHPNHVGNNSARIGEILDEVIESYVKTLYILSVHILPEKIFINKKTCPTIFLARPSAFPR